MKIRNLKLRDIIGGKMKSLKSKKIEITQEQYNDVESLLYNHSKIKNKIIMLSENIDYIVLKNYKLFLDGLPPGTSMDIKSEIEKKDELKARIIEEIARYGKLSKLVNDSLALINEEKYFEIINLKYFKKSTIEQISQKMNISISWVKEKTTELIKQLAEIIFMRDDYISNRNIHTLENSNKKVAKK